MNRCMTCDELLHNVSIMLELSDCEAIGVCERCLVVIRTFCTLQADAQSEYRLSQGRDGWVTTLTADEQHRVHRNRERRPHEGCPREPAQKTARKVKRKTAARKG